MTVSQNPKPNSDKAFRAISRKLPRDGISGPGFDGLTMLTDTKLKNLKGADIEKCLAHEQKGVRAVYNKAEYAEQRRDMLQQWADIVDDYMSATV